MATQRKTADHSGSCKGTRPAHSRLVVVWVLSRKRHILTFQRRLPVLLLASRRLVTGVQTPTWSLKTAGGFEAVLSVKQFVLTEINLVCFYRHTSPTLERSPEGKPPPLRGRWTHFPDLASLLLTFRFHIHAGEKKKKKSRSTRRSRGVSNARKLISRGAKKYGSFEQFK